MEKEKNNKGLIIVLIIIIIILATLCVLFATDTISLKGNENNTDITNNNVANEENTQEETQEQYDGIDPWGNELTITIISNNTNMLDWIISNEIYEQEIKSELNEKSTKFNIQGTTKDGENEFNYGGTLTLNEDSVTVKYESGQLTSISTAGGGGAYHVDALEESAKTVILKKK